MAALILAWLMAGSASAAVPRGIVVVPVGKVEVLAQTSGQWERVRRPVRIAQGDEVRTGNGAQAQILLSDGSRLSLSENAHFAVQNDSLKQSTFKLSVGKLKAYFAGVFSSRLEIRTPTAVCAVRGTEFELNAQPQGATQVNVDEGHLEVSDKQGQQAVVTAEETVSVGQSGMDEPHVVSLSDERAQPAARPEVVMTQVANDATRSMLEELRNRELKANEAQLGKDVIDAFGRRVRLEEYLLRPASNQFKLLFLSTRESRFDWGQYVETFHARIPDDITQVPAIVAGTYFSKTMPSNWLTNVDFYATNTIDSIEETIALGDPVAVNFCGLGICGSRYYPKSMDHKQVLSGPGVPGGTRTQFDQTQSISGNVFTWSQSIIDNTGALSSLDQFQEDVSNVGDVNAGGCSLGGETCFDNSPVAYNSLGGAGNGKFTSFVPAVTSFPSGKGKADFFSETVYGDGSTVSARKMLVSNDGEILDFRNIATGDFLKSGDYNLEEVVGSSLFQGRDIDILIAPEILNQKNNAGKTPDNF